MSAPNQIERLREDVKVSAADLLKVPEGSITIKGLENNVSAALRYTEAWLGGQGAVPIYNLMEDAATAEIARAQVWQWIRHPKGVLADGRRITREFFRELLDLELKSIKLHLGEPHYRSRKYELAGKLLDDMISRDSLPEFLTLEAYPHVAGT
jgi:malate synthase